MIIAVRIIAAAEMTTSLVEFGFADCLGRDRRDAILAGASEGSAAGGMSGCGGVVRTKLTGATLGEALRGRTSLGGTRLRGTLLGGTLLGATVLA
jgi:hypothetical protein